MADEQKKAMSFLTIFQNLIPYVKPHRWLIVATLGLTLIGACLAQVNALVIQYAVDKVSLIITAMRDSENSFPHEGLTFVLTIAGILLGKEILVALTSFCQRYLGAKLRISISKSLALKAVDRVLTYGMTFFSARDNDAGKLQTRINRGAESLTRLVNNFFLDILPLVTNAAIALVLMFRSSAVIGSIALAIIPVFFAITLFQGKKLRGRREKHRHFWEAKNHAILNLIQAMPVIKSFNRQQIEAEKQYDLQDQIKQNELTTARTGFVFDGLKSFVEQIGVVIIIIVSSWLVIMGGNEHRRNYDAGHAL